MKKRKLTYQFHNPNTAEATADMLLKVLIEASSKRVEKVVQEAVEQLNEVRECDGLIV